MRKRERSVSPLPDGRSEIRAYDTWWGMGKSYLCRLVDMLHMGLVDEILFGREVVARIPVLVTEWIAEARAGEQSGPIGQE